MSFEPIEIINCTFNNHPEFDKGAASRQAEIGEIIKNLIKRADEKASEPHIRDTEYAYFQGMADGLNTLMHSMGLDDDFDKILRGEENEN